MGGGAPNIAAPVLNQAAVQSVQGMINAGGVPAQTAIANIQAQLAVANATGQNLLPVGSSVGFQTEAIYISPLTGKNVSQAQYNADLAVFNQQIANGPFPNAIVA